jgi:hypothetical protein
LALAEMIDYIQTALMLRKSVYGVFMDVPKAFDCVSHDILLCKLGRYGIRGKAQDLIRSYLTARTRYVQIEQTTSELLQTHSGIPQGSKLRPLFYILYCNYIVNVVKHGKVCLYADDTNIFYSSVNVNNLESFVNEDLFVVNESMNKNKLSLNLKKTKYVNFENKHDKSVDIAISINGIHLDRVVEIKFLGIHLDSSLNWDVHIKRVSDTLAILGLKLVSKSFRMNE